MTYRVSSGTLSLYSLLIIVGRRVACSSRMFIRLFHQVNIKTQVCCHNGDISPVIIIEPRGIARRNYSAPLNHHLNYGTYVHSIALTSFIYLLTSLLLTYT